MPGLLEGHPDSWWGGHDWDIWWMRLLPDQRAQLLELGWGEPMPPGFGIVWTSLRGAATAHQVVLESTPTHLRTRSVVTQWEPTDEFLIWLEEKRTESS